MTEAKTIEIEIPMEEGEPLGATPNDKLVIMKVQAGTVAEGKLQIGDQITQVNGTKITDTNTFFKALRFAPPVARITIVRDEKKAEELAERNHIPPDRERYVQRRDGFTYFIAKLTWVKGGPKLGLGIKHYQNRVLISRCDPGSLASQSFAVGDHVIDIDSHPVTDKDVARDMLVKALGANGTCTCVVERPDSLEAKQWIKNALAVQQAAPPSVQMNSDVREIAAREREKVLKKIPPRPSIYTPGKVLDKRVTINEGIGSHIIASDNEGRQLRSVKK